MNDFMPIELDVDNVTISTVGSGEWEITIECSDGVELYHYTDPDGLYDQLIEKGILVHENEGIVQS